VRLHIAAIAAAAVSEDRDMEWTKTQNLEGKMKKAPFAFQFSSEGWPRARRRSARRERC
jgi:hypothetical protein